MKTNPQKHLQGSEIVLRFIETPAKHKGIAYEHCGDVELKQQKFNYSGSEIDAVGKSKAEKDEAVII